MKSFIKNIIAFLLLYVAMSIIITVTSDYHYGNQIYSSKIRFLETEKDRNYNAFFFGSSKAYRELNPHTFDSLMNLNGQYNVQSFNLGAPAATNPEAYYLYENFLNSPLSVNAKYCFLELRHVESLTNEKLHSEQTTYWQNSSDIRYSSNSIMYGKKQDPLTKAKVLSNYWLSYFENMFHIGHFGNAMLNKDHYDLRFVGRNKDGFYPIQYDLEEVTKPDKKEQFQGRRQVVIDSPDTLNTYRNQVLSHYQDDSESYNTYDLERVKNLIQLSKEKGIHLIFFTSPPKPRKQTVRLSREIPEGHFIDLYNPIRYEHFYDPAYYFDRGHMNLEGSNLITTVLAERVKEILPDVMER